MVSARRMKMTLAANDEFWFSPITQDIASALNNDNDNEHEVDDCNSSCSCSSTTSSFSRRDSMELTLPAAHHQLLSNDLPTIDNLKGYDHREPVVSFDNFDSFEPSLGEELDLDTSFFEERSKLSHVKQQGGGSWLLGFARMRDESESNTSQEEGNALPELARIESEDESSQSSSSDNDDDSTTSSTTPTTKPKSKGVSFSEAVEIQPIPHSSTLRPLQRRKMFTTVMEVRTNKQRNKREYRYDGCDWRNATEEWEMGVDMVTGELVHPAHNDVHHHMNNINWS